MEEERSQHSQVPSGVLDKHTLSFSSISNEQAGRKAGQKDIEWMRGIDWHVLLVVFRRRGGWAEHSTTLQR